MAILENCKTHNMVAYLQKPEGSEVFHQIVDFLNRSYIRYAITQNPTIYVSQINQFWQTAKVKTLANGEKEINATVDGIFMAITESSVRRHLKLSDNGGISSLPNDEIFQNLYYMGYGLTFDNLTFQKPQFPPQWRFLIHTVVHCLSPKKTCWEQFSSNIATAIVCLATKRKFNFSKLIFDGMVKNVKSKYKFLMYPRFIQIILNKHKKRLQPHKNILKTPTLSQKVFRNMRMLCVGYNGREAPLFLSMIVPPLEGQGSATQVESHDTPISGPSSSEPQVTQTFTKRIRNEYVVPQPISPTQPNVADEPICETMVRAATTLTGLEAGQASGKNDKTQPMETSNDSSSHDAASGDANPMPHDSIGGMPHGSPVQKLNTDGSDVGSLKYKELMDICTKLSDRVTGLEENLKNTKQIYARAYTKLIQKVKKLSQKLKDSKGKSKSTIVDYDSSEDLVEFDLDDVSKPMKFDECA